MAMQSQDEGLEEKIADIQGAATVDWSPLGEIYVKKYRNYFLDWQVNLADYVVAIASYGGPVALLPKKHSARTTLNIYTLAGIQIASIPWEGGNAVGLGWTSSEKLICVLEEGTMLIYDIQGQYLFTKVIAREVREHRVKSCKFFCTAEGTSGFAVMTYNCQFFVNADSDAGRDDLRVKKLADLPSPSVMPSCWAVLPQGAQANVLASVDDKLFLVDPFESTEQFVTCKKDGPLCWAEIAVSLDGKAVALVDKEGYIWGGSNDFRTCETEFDLQSTSRVLQMLWGGKDFFVLVMERLMFVKGFGKHWCKYTLTAPCHLHPEIDGVRIFTNVECSFIHRVTTPSLAVLKIGSMEVGALLNDAFKEYQGVESHKADEYIRYIKDRLPEAVTQCIRASGEEFLPKIQQSLLKSANFGKGFLGPDIPRDVVNEFVEMCHQLRVLNSVRDDQIGIPITTRQYYRLSTGVLIDRLINRGLYPLAMEICTYLKIPPAVGEVKILRSWALRKVVDKGMDENEVAQVIIDKLMESTAVVSFAEIARAAKAVNRSVLAAKLLDHEVQAKHQIPLLMEMKKADLALDRAIESGDPQLVYQVLDDLRFKHYHSQTDRYLQLFHHRPVAAALYKKLCRETDREQLLRLCRQESDFLEAGCIHFVQSFSKTNPTESNRCLSDAMKEFRDGQHLFSLKATEEQAKLMKEQLDIESATGLRVLGMSVITTIMECVCSKQGKLAEQLRKDFRVSDNQFWWAKLRGLASIGDYAEVERFAKQKKSPIGFEPFAEVCIQHGNFREAAKYIPRASAQNRFRLYIIIEDFPKAADAAFQERNLDDLDEVQSKAYRNAELVEHIKHLKSRLGYK